ncbi:MAG: tRNA 2-thiouridine(34) synthase MnmA [Deltaproteobacteria bacterium]|nr:tRNA 2-thiouridine(34) synthase MnmA [Myxococcales bacterium]MDP3217813.1 tRNA 2-thiouridine(34) synthase MnmA [Deltaproteobacteria bacterium]
MARRIVVGMSGGVDSSAAAAMLHRDGWEVIGVTLHLWDYVREGHAGRCCSPEDQYDAARVCASLGVAHYTFDRRDLFREKVVDRFVEDYAAGRTPSPCVRCNESVKLGPLWEIAERLGAEAVATGHYARVATDGDGIDLRAAADAAKDQSYFLWAAPLDALRRLHLPLGAMTKPEVRAVAAAAGLVNADKPESVDLCFLEGQAYPAFMARHGGANTRPGNIETADGEVVGRHDGVHAFTPGQRRGLGAGGRPRYVLKIVPERAAVVVADDEGARGGGATLEGFRWLCDARPGRVRARIRYRHQGVGATLEETGGGGARLRFDEPQRGVAPGQAAVIYEGDRVVGGGWIAEVPS